MRSMHEPHIDENPTINQFDPMQLNSNDISLSLSVVCRAKEVALKVYEWCVCVCVCEYKLSRDDLSHVFCHEHTRMDDILYRVPHIIAMHGLTE